MQKIGLAFNAVILLGFTLFALGVVLYVINLLSHLRLNLEMLVIALGILLLIFGVAGARIFSSLQLTQ